MSDKNTYYPLMDEETLKKKLGGMTVTERLYETGKLAAFDEASKKRDKSRVAEILRSVYVSEESITRILATI